MHAPAPNALVVTTDRRALDRFSRPRIIVAGVCLALILALSVGAVVLLASLSAAGSSPPAAAGSTLLICVLVTSTSTVQLAMLGQLWRRMRAIDVRVVADDAGLRAVLPGVDVLVPWHAVHHARLQGSGGRHRLTLLSGPL